MADKFISIKQLSKFYIQKDKEVRIFNNINLEIEPREFIVLLGPSGCGKSTFLKVFGGIETPSSGTINLEGETFKNGMPRYMLREFGYVFQNPNLLPWRTAEKNVSLIFEFQKENFPNWQSRVDEILKLVGLYNYRKMYPHELSGGMQQRLGIARSLVHNPKILLMDQPMGALDAITRKILVFELLKIWKKTQKNIVMVTNNVDEAIILGNRILIFSKLPATIIDEIIVDIPFEERNPHIVSNKRYIEIHNNISSIIRSF